MRVVMGLCVAVVTLTLALTAPLSATGWSASASAVQCWHPPVVGRVVDPYRKPPCPYCAGNRGIEYEVAPRTQPTAVAAGMVSFAGVVVDTRYVVVALGDGRLVTYGRLVDSHLRAGDRVVAGAVVGTASGPFYFGVRRGDSPVDPTPLLGTWGGTPRLVPTDGGVGHPAPMRLRCAAMATSHSARGGATRPIV
ncbi:MAG: M23 family metallopeptidase [Actinomycetota bacterium]